jgi:hypothetical protein
MRPGTTIVNPSGRLQEARVFLEPDAAAALEDKTLDVQATLDEGVTFVITPQA